MFIMHIWHYLFVSRACWSFDNPVTRLSGLFPCNTQSPGSPRSYDKTRYLLANIGPIWHIPYITRHTTYISLVHCMFIAGQGSMSWNGYMKCYAHCNPLSGYVTCLANTVSYTHQIPWWVIHQLYTLNSMMTSSSGSIFRVTGLCAGNSPVNG